MFINEVLCLVREKLSTYGWRRPANKLKVENTVRRNQAEREANSLKSFKKWLDTSPMRVTFTGKKWAGSGSGDDSEKFYKEPPGLLGVFLFCKTG